jgi:high mobility group protein B1/high mobility group protein B3
MAINYSTKYITDFLNTYGDEQIQNKWVESQDSFKKGLKKLDKKGSKSLGPKKGKTAYNIYCSEIRDTIKKEMPDLDNKAVFGEMAKRWDKIKNSNSKEFSRYQQMAEQDKERFLKEKSEFVDEVVESDEDIPLKKIKKKVAAGGPKKAKSSYMFFCEDERPNVKDVTGKEVLVELGRRWKVLKESDSKKFKMYEAKAEADKARYTKEKNGGGEDPVSEEVVVAPVEKVVVEKESKKKPKGEKKNSKK